MTPLLDVLVPAAAAIFGAIVGGVTAGLLQIRSTAMSAFIPARLDAYRAVEAALRNAASCAAPASAFRDVYEAVNAAMLVASGKTLPLLSELNEIVRAKENFQQINQAEFFDLRKRLLLSMREDLFTYPVPRKSKGM